MLPIWTNQYVNIPYRLDGITRAGVDCWGLIRLVYKDQYGLTLGTVSEILDAVRRGEWPEISRDEVQEGDILLFFTGELQKHVAIALDSVTMLHADAGTNSCIQRFDGILWKDRLEKVYRHGTS